MFRLEALSLCIAHAQLNNKLVHFDTTGMYFNHHKWGVLEVAYTNLRSYTQGPDTRSGQYILFGLHQSPQAIVRCPTVSWTRECVWHPSSPPPAPARRGATTRTSPRLYPSPSEEHCIVALVQHGGSCARFVL